MLLMMMTHNNHNKSKKNVFRIFCGKQNPSKIMQNNWVYLL